MPPTVPLQQTMVGSSLYHPFIRSFICSFFICQPPTEVSSMPRHHESQGQIREATDKVQMCRSSINCHRENEYKHEYILLISQAGAGFVFPSRLRCMAYRLFQESSQGISLGVQWLRLHAPNAGGEGSIPGQGERRSHILCSAARKKKKKGK